MASAHDSVPWTMVNGPWTMGPGAVVAACWDAEGEAAGGAEGEAAGGADGVASGAAAGDAVTDELELAAMHPASIAIARATMARPTADPCLPCARSTSSPSSMPSQGTAGSTQRAQPT